MIQTDFKCLFATSVKCSDYKTSPFVHKLAKHIPFAAVAVERKIGYKVIHKQVIIQSLIVNTAFYIYGNSSFYQI